MSIDASKACVGMHVFYQQPHMTGAEYGVIASVDYAPIYIHVRFNNETTVKACHPRNLYWPPDFCKMDGVNPPGQLFGEGNP